MRKHVDINKKPHTNIWWFNKISLVLIYGEPVEPSPQ